MLRSSGCHALHVTSVRLNSIEHDEVHCLQPHGVLWKLRLAGIIYFRAHG